MKCRILKRQLWMIMASCMGSIVAMAGNSHQPTDRDSIIIHKLNNNHRHSVNIYTNTSQKVLFFSAKGDDNSTYKLLLFKQKGVLVKQSKIKNRETTVVSKPEKGRYYYEVFSDDVLIESGTIVVH